MFFLIIGYTSYFISSGGLFNAVAKEVYRYDTRSSFQCNDKYWIIPELGREARYLMDTPNNYRAIYIENNSVHVTAVVCKKDGGYTRYPIESAEDILKNPLPKEPDCHHLLDVESGYAVDAGASGDVSSACSGLC